ncbi:MAG TPA: SDR family oxidoreductase [Gaiellaceae bacterium]|nr:SDR family oxidoreductase [Gaiellaceae bacterium]
MLLEHKNAVIYGAGGAIGGAVARAFAREGARVFLAGRTLAALDEVAEEISGAGGAAETARVDALDEEMIEAHAMQVAEKAGGIDVSFNAISLGDVQGTPLLEMPLEDFTNPIVTGATTHFLTATATARHMLRRRSGVILTLSASAAPVASSPEPGHGLGGFGVACAAIEALSRCLAGELGPHGIRVVCLRPEGIPETWPDEFRAQRDSPGDWGYGGATRESFGSSLASTTLLKRLPTLAEVANVAAFMASDRAGAMTATIGNLTCGAIVD